MASTVWVKPLNGTWQPVGGGADRGVWHEGLTCVSDQWGPKTCTFTLKRQRRAAYPDLLARTPIMVEEGSVTVWRGRIRNAPEQDGRERAINIECEGGQAILDDDKLERILVHTKLADYKDTRGQLAANLASFTASGQVTSSEGAIQIGWPNDTALSGTDNRVGVVLDLGPGNTAKRIVLTADSSNNIASMTFYARGASSGAADPPNDAFTFAMNAIGSGVFAGTFPTASRYVHLFIYYGGAGATTSADYWVRIKSVQVFADTAYESSGASVLSARTIIVDALTRATTGLHADWAGIGDPSFAFPNFAPDQPRSPRDLIAAAAAPHSRWQFKLDEQLRPIFRERPTVPIVELGAWMGDEQWSLSSNNADGVVTKVIVRGQDSAGTPLRSTRTQAGTIVDRQGTVATVTLDASYVLTQTFADQLGDARLQSNRVSPFKGQAAITREGARRVMGGPSIRPAHLLLLTGELARRTDLIDPDTGALGRAAVIDQVTWRADTDDASLDLDNTRRDFEALQERLGLLVPA